MKKLPRQDSAPHAEHQKVPGAIVFLIVTQYVLNLKPYMCSFKSHFVSQMNKSDALHGKAAPPRARGELGSFTQIRSGRPLRGL